ncbi:hypothetical protein [Streptomyces sp. NPDC001985]|uniref:hypothetical protein n=1 Tax=Streptomyces sp. NPDC001985 TaxID=3154406 RepID=UPI003321D4C0
MGARLHRPMLRAAAEAIPRHGQERERLAPAGLVAEALGTIPGVGPWTAQTMGPARRGRLHR